MAYGPITSHFRPSSDQFKMRVHFCVFTAAATKSIHSDLITTVHCESTSNHRLINLVTSVQLGGNGCTVVCSKPCQWSLAFNHQTWPLQIATCHDLNVSFKERLHLQTRTNIPHWSWRWRHIQCRPTEQCKTIIKYKTEQYNILYPPWDGK